MASLFKKDFFAIIRNACRYAVWRIRIGGKRFWHIRLRKYFTNIYKVKEAPLVERPLEWAARHHVHLLLGQHEQVFGGGRVLEIGPNQGNEAILQARKGHMIHMLDINVPALRGAKNHIAVQPDGKELAMRLFPVAGLAQAMPFKAGSFGGVYMFDVIEHIFRRDRNSVLAGIKEILKPGGYLLIGCPNGHAYDDGTQHVCFYSRKSLDTFLRKMGFDVEYVKNYREVDKNNEKHNYLIAFAQKPR